MQWYAKGYTAVSCRGLQCNATLGLQGHCKEPHCSLITCAQPFAQEPKDDNTDILGIDPTGPSDSAKTELEALEAMCVQCENLLEAGETKKKEVKAAPKKKKKPQQKMVMKKMKVC